MSSTRQAVTRSLSLTGLGKSPLLTRLHNVADENGTMVGISCDCRTKPTAGRSAIRRCDIASLLGRIATRAPPRWDVLSNTNELPLTADISSSYSLGMFRSGRVLQHSARPTSRQLPTLCSSLRQTAHAAAALITDTSALLCGFAQNAAQSSIIRLRLSIRSPRR